MNHPANPGIISRLAGAPAWTIALLCAWGLLTNWAIVRTWNIHMWSGVQDFTVLYGGGRLAGTSSLYSHSALRAVEHELLGTDSEDFPYVRLPAVALAWKPLTFIPYQPALVLWKVMTVIGFISVAWLLPFPGRRTTFVAVAVSFGACDALLFGQDVWLTALALAAFVRLSDRGRDGPAGFFLGLAVTLKYHLFPLAILTLLLNRKWRTLSAAALVFGGAIVVSRLVQGPSWPGDYLRALANTGAPHEYMPNVAGLAATLGLGVRGYLAIACAAAIAVVVIARQSSTQFAFGIAVFAGILIAPHGYAYDYSLFIPALLPLAAKHPWFESHCTWWLMPFPLAAMAVGYGLPGQILIVLAGAATLYAAAQFSTRRESATAASPRNRSEIAGPRLAQPA